MPRTSRIISFVLSWMLLGLAVIAYFNHQNILDWWRIRHYMPPAKVLALSTSTTMTAKGTHLFYSARPAIDDKTAFVNHCKANEQTIVLGCYTGLQQIYILDVTDSRLQGVEEVTAAHEMLHAAYDRLPAKEKARVNTMLQQAYDQITDERLRKTMDLYKQTEPNDVVNELHSILGTEVANLPSGLEDYYKQYFSDRAKIVKYSADYQAAFTSRQKQAQDLQAQMNTIKFQINSLENQLRDQQQALQSQRGSVHSASEADAFNAQVRQYNAGVDKLSDLIDQYNKLVNEYNGLVVQEQELKQALDSHSVQTETTQ